jgi:hypothetical protein
MLLHVVIATSSVRHGAATLTCVYPVSAARIVCVSVPVYVQLRSCCSSVSLYVYSERWCLQSNPTAVVMNETTHNIYYNDTPCKCLLFTHCTVSRWRKRVLRVHH